MSRLAPLLLLAACGTPIPTGADEAVLDCYTYHYDEFTLDNARVEGDDLELEVSVSACGKHALYTCWDGEFEGAASATEANPPRVNITVGHDARGGGCNDTSSHTKRFSLDEVRAAYEDEYPEGVGRLVLVIDDGTTVQYPLQ